MKTQIGKLKLFCISWDGDADSWTEQWLTEEEAKDIEKMGFTVMKRGAKK